jgi:hypothetical protein
MRTVGTVFLLFALLFGGSCSSDRDTPVGSEFLGAGYLGTGPGKVVQDTLRVESGEVSFRVGDYLFNTDRLELGRKDGVESWPVLRPDFSAAGDDTLLVVKEATLRLVMSETSETLNAVFMELGAVLADSDTLKGIALADTIPDENGVSSRTMAFADPNYGLPPALVQEWIRGKAPNNGIAVVLDDPSDTTRVTFQATEKGADLRPTIKVIFTNNEESTYLMSVDGTFTRDLYTTPNLLLSDGVTRRVLIPVDLTGFNAKTLVHEAKLVLHYVPDSFLGEDLSVTLYAPGSTDIGDPDVLTGTPVASTVMSKESDFLSFSIRNILAILLAKQSKDNALVLQYTYEGSAIRRVEFYGSGAPADVAPYFTFTFSTTPDYEK